MADRRPWWLVVLAVFSVGVAVRLAFLVWSPLPATLDGIRYARLATDAVASGHLSLAGIDADEVVFTAVLAVTSATTGQRPLTLAQPVAAWLGGAIGLAGVVLVRRLGTAIGLGDRDRYRAAAVAGLALAVDGLLLRRSGTPDEEALGLVLVPLFAVAAWRTLRTRRPAWVAVTVLLGATFPPLHNFSSLLAAVVLTAVLVAGWVERPTPAAGVATLVAGGAFWAYFLGYFEVAASLGLRLTYSGLIADRPGIFLAWVVVLAVGTAWVRTTAAGPRRLALGVPFACFFALLGANAVRPVFPGTVPTAPRVLWLVAPYLVPVAVFAWASALLGRRDRGRGGASVVLALVTGPLVVVLFALTTSLTPQFFGTAIRGQNFLHAAVFVLAAVGAVWAGRARRRGRLRSVLVAAVLVAALVTLPLGYLDLDTGTPPNTTLESDFAAAGFASTRVPGTYATEHPRSRIAIHWYGDAPAVAPVAEWVAGGPPPECPTVAERSWTTTGVHLYPRPPRTIPPDRYRAWTARNDVVYASTGEDGTVVVLPPGEGANCGRGPRSADRRGVARER